MVQTNHFLLFDTNDANKQILAHGHGHPKLQSFVFNFRLIIIMCVPAFVLTKAKIQMIIVSFVLAVMTAGAYETPKKSWILYW